MSPLDKKKVSVELLQVQAARASLELRIEERLEEIERLKENIKISLTREDELKDKLKKAEES